LRQPQKKIREIVAGAAHDLAIVGRAGGDAREIECSAAIRIGARGVAMVAISLGVAFSLFAFYGAGLEANLWGLVLMLGGLAVRWICRLRLRATKLSAEGAA